jgi:diguanylate cyclase (GGDEF)-like protein
MRQTPKQRLMAILERTLNNLSTDELRGLFLPDSHNPILTRRRVGIITSRVRAISTLFAILTPAWIVIDLAVFPWPIWSQLAALRLAASLSFAALAFFSGKSTKINSAYREIAIMFGIPILFFISSHYLLSQHLLHGASDAVATGYAFLPFVMVAGLSVFPLAAVEGLAYAIPVLAVEIGVAALHLDDLGWDTHLGSLWLLFLIAVVATLSSMSQLGLMMALVRQTIRDCLTGCFTRNTGEELLEIQFNISQRNQSPLALVFADLDNFKAINDIHGHEAGDRALVQASNTLSKVLRISDVLVRWGGEEFVLILPNTDRNNAISIIERLQAFGLGLRPDGKPMTASFGIAECLGDRAKNWRELVEIADQRMYAAKQLGKNRWIGDDRDFFALDVTAQPAN